MSSERCLEDPPTPYVPPQQDPVYDSREPDLSTLRLSFGSQSTRPFSPARMAEVTVIIEKVAIELDVFRNEENEVETPVKSIDSDKVKGINGLV
ncbi:hypothetical protein QCA50_007890 [Cerrena zonata]|uniref:Uncharacterized protein n=1 Tax=Cerrena zonata TaxID=2478898 RepID=A0AAW0GHH6_9APHY